MPDYREIYNDVVSRDQRYNMAENSPGFRVAIESTPQLTALSGRSLDVGCGVGFVLEYLNGSTFDLMPYGVDISDHSVQKAKNRLAHISGAPSRIQPIDSHHLPFEDEYFNLVTCFDVLEHLDEPDIDKLWTEIRRVLHPTGVFLGAVSCRASGIVDKNGDNLHRTVCSVDWWLEKLDPDTAEFDALRSQLKVWRRPRHVKPAIRIRPESAQ